MTNILVSISFAVIGLIVGLAIGHGIDCIVGFIINGIQSPMPPLSDEWSNVAINTIDNMQSIVGAIPEPVIFKFLGAIIGAVGGVVTSAKF